MYRPSKAFLERVGREPFEVWAVGRSGSVAVDHCTVTLGWSGAQFGLGAACAGEWKATVQQSSLPLAQGEAVRLELGLRGLTERVPMGVFTLQSVRRDIDEDRYTLTGRDAFGAAMEEPYGGSDSLPAPAVLQEICRRGGFAVPQEILPEDVMLTVEEKTMRTLLGELALLCGGNAGIDRTGALRLGGWTGEVCALGPEDYYQSKLQLETKDYVLGLLEVKDGETTYEAQLPGLQQGLSLQGPMTQGAFDRMWNRWKNTAFRPGQVELPDGMWLDPGDLIQITDCRGQKYTVPVLQVTHTFDGGFRTVVRAQTAEFSVGTVQTVSQAVSGLKVDIGRFHKVYTEKLEAAEATLKQLQTDVLQARTILVRREDGEVILRADADTGELIATSGTVGGLTLSEHTLSAEYRHDYPKFTQADLDRAQQGILGSITLTEEEQRKYDVNMDGKVTAVDLLAMRKMFKGTEASYSLYQLTIDPARPNACLRVQVVDGYHAGWGVELGIGMGKMRNLSVSGQMSVQGRTLADFVVEQGFDSVWEWRKWNSGLAECWGTYTFAPVQMEAWGSMYSSVEQGLQPLRYPLEFVKKPVCTLSLEDASVDCFLFVAANEDYDRTTYTPMFQLMRPTQAPGGTIQPTVSFHVVGRWE